jgi:hypothetical protein
MILDPFLGSGDPCYADVIVTRWQELTGKKAVLEADGRTFQQVAEERKPSQETTLHAT